MITAMVVVLLSSCSNEIVQSSLQTTAFTEKIDSSDMETLRFYDSESKLQYSISNDLQNLYISIKATEDFTQFKLIRAGMQLNIGGIGKKLLAANIQYPLAMGGAPTNAGNNQRRQAGMPQGRDINGLKLMFKSKYQELRLSGFKAGVPVILPLHNEQGINVNLDWDANNTLYYKAIIPFKTFYKDILEQSDTAKILDVSIIINGMPMPKSGENGDNMEGGSPETGMTNGRMGGGRMGGSSMGGGRQGGGQGGGQAHDAMTEPNKVKLKLQLVVPKK